MLSQSLILVDSVNSTETRDLLSYNNAVEGSLVLQVVRKLTLAGVPPTDIGIQKVNLKI